MSLEAKREIQSAFLRAIQPDSVQIWFRIMSLPPSPFLVLARVVRISSFNGRFLLVIGAAFALLSALAHVAFGAIIGCLVAGAGAMEMHGSSLLRQGESRGLGWLIRAELGLLGLVLCYASLNLIAFDPALVERSLTPDMLKTLDQAKVTKEQFLEYARIFNIVFFSGVCVASLLYQGGLAFFYSRKRAAVVEAIDSHDVEPAHDDA